MAWHGMAWTPNHPPGSRCCCGGSVPSACIPSPRSRPSAGVWPPAHCSYPLCHTHCAYPLCIPIFVDTASLPCLCHCLLALPCPALRLAMPCLCPALISAHEYIYNVYHQRLNHTLVPITSISITSVSIKPVSIKPVYHIDIPDIDTPGTSNRRPTPTTLYQDGHRRPGPHLDRGRLLPLQRPRCDCGRYSFENLNISAPPACV